MVAAIFVMLTVGLLVGVVPGTAHNWGSSDKTPGPNSPASPDGFLCPEDPAVLYWKGECTTDDQFEDVYIGTTVPSLLRTALIDSINNDYNPITDFQMHQVTSPDSDTDTYVLYGNIDPSADVSFSYCPPGAHYGLVGIRYHMWCHPMYVAYQTSGDDCWLATSSACRNHYACHELGHSAGLQHTDSLSNPDTCMSYSSAHPTTLRPHDEDHLTNCYPHPTPPLPTFPAETRTNACKNP